MKIDYQFGLKLTERCHGGRKHRGNGWVMFKNASEPVFDHHADREVRPMPMQQFQCGSSQYTVTQGSYANDRNARTLRDCIERTGHSCTAN